MSAKPLALIPLLIILTQLYLQRRGEPCRMSDDMDVLKEKLDKCVVSHQKGYSPQDSRGKTKGLKRKHVEQESPTMDSK